jgi:tripartite-type tricarboxylate transporter receptor subunit TctC
MRCCLERSLHFLALSLLLAAATAGAQSYPSKPVKVIVPQTGGSGVDIVARIGVTKIAQNMGSPFVVENLSRFTGPMAVARAAPDGHTLMFYTEALPIMALLNQAQGFDPMKDFQLFGTLARAAFILTVGASVPVRSVEELVQLARAKPGFLNYGTSSVGSPHHLVTELFLQANGLNMVHVPFKGSGETVTALLAGTVPLAMGLPSSFSPHIKSGKFRALAVTSARRVAAFPDVPSLAERAVSPVEYESWWGMFAQAAAPRPLMERLHAELGKVLADKAYVEDQLGRHGLEPFEQPSAAAAAALAWNYYNKLAPVVKQAGIKGD